MPDLGRYAVPVLGSYAAAVLLVLALVALSVWQSRRVHRALTAAESRTGRNRA